MRAVSSCPSRSRLRWFLGCPLLEAWRSTRGWGDEGEEKKRNENSRSGGERAAASALGAGRAGLQEAWAAPGGGQQQRRRGLGGLEKGGIVSVCLRDGGGARGRSPARPGEGAAGARRGRGAPSALETYPQVFVGAQ